MPFPRRALPAVLTGLGLAVGSACTADPAPAPAPAVVDPAASTWQTADDAGGIEALVAAAQQERRLTLVGFSPDRANYGAIIAAFEQEYGIEVDSTEPDASAQRQIDAANERHGTERAPDVLDLDQAVTLTHDQALAPYRPRTFAEVDGDLRAVDGRWINGYGKFMSIGYDPSKIFGVSSLEDLTLPDARGGVAIAGDPTSDAVGYYAVLMASLAHGGTADDIGPGIDFFADLERSGNFVTTPATDDTIVAGTTSMVIDWDQRNLASRSVRSSWMTMVPSEAQVGVFSYLAVNLEAPHPAAARLWQEFVLGDVGQNLILRHGVRPIRVDAMAAAGTVDKDAYARLPPLAGQTVVADDAQRRQGTALIKERWPTEVGG